MGSQGDKQDAGILYRIVRNRAKNIQIKIRVPQRIACKQKVWLRQCQKHNKSKRIQLLGAL